MSHINIIRAWKDPEYRLSLSEAKQAHPAEFIELTDMELGAVMGGECQYVPPVGPPSLCSVLPTQPLDPVGVVWGFASAVVEVLQEHWLFKP